MSILKQIIYKSIFQEIIYPFSRQVLLFQQLISCLPSFFLLHFQTNHQHRPLTTLFSVLFWEENYFFFQVTRKIKIFFFQRMLFFGICHLTILFQIHFPNANGFNSLSPGEKKIKYDRETKDFLAKKGERVSRVSRSNSSKCQQGIGNKNGGSIVSVMSVK